MVASGKSKGVSTKISDFFTHARRSGFWPCAQSVHRSAVTRARAKVPWQSFRSLFQQVVLLAYECFPSRSEYTWQGYSVWGIDGSDYRLPATQTLRHAFDPQSGLQHPGKGHYPQCLVSTLYDVFRRIPIARTVAPLSRADERLQALRLLRLAPIMEKVILLFDRGYPSFGFLHRLLLQKRLFLMRCPAYSSFPAVAAFMSGGALEANIWLMPSNQFKLQVSKRERKTLQPLLLRVVRLEHPDGTVSALITNLFDPTLFSRSALIALYQRRWAIETHYRDEKTQLQIETFHSRTINGVRQELFAILVAMVMARTITALSVESESIESEHCYVLPQLKNAIMVLAREAALLTPDDPVLALNLFAELIEAIRHVKYYKPKQPRPSQPRVNKAPINKWQQDRAKKICAAA